MKLERAQFFFVSSGKTMQRRLHREKTTLVGEMVLKGGFRQFNFKMVREPFEAGQEKDGIEKMENVVSELRCIWLTRPVSRPAHSALALVCRRRVPGSSSRRGRALC